MLNKNFISLTKSHVEFNLDIILDIIHIDILPSVYIQNKIILSDKPKRDSVRSRSPQRALRASC